MQATVVAMIQRLLCALMSIGAFVACTPIAEPIAVPTFTLVPPTLTSTLQPASDTPVPSATPEAFATTTATPVPINVLIETTITPQAGIVAEVRRDLAERLNVSPERVQFAQVEAVQWLGDPRLCTTTPPARRSAVEQVLMPTIGYRYRLLLGSDLYSYQATTAGDYLNCDDPQALMDELLLQVDPLASDMVFVVQRQLADQLDLSTRRVQLVDIAPYTWTDTSLGCPQPEQTYSEANIAGYRIVVRAGNTEYLYHSDAISAFPCDPEREVLPQ
jgi:hypothetical protein